MDQFLFGLVCGVLVGGWVIDLNLRSPAAIREWFKAKFSA